MILIHLLTTVFLPVATLASPANQKRINPEVQLTNGKIVGSSAWGVDSFLGIPFAQPPVGALRLEPPRSITSSLGTIIATAAPRVCPQSTATSVDTSQLGGNATTLLNQLPTTPTAAAVSDSPEGCLTLNIQRPSTITSSSKLPVLFWIFGGGFTAGSTQNYDESSLIAASVASKKDMIFVAVNYRVGGFGLLSSKEIVADGSTNLGIRDQRVGLQWVADNIAAFGGDPTKVTIWGESAGSASVFMHMVYNDGGHTYKGKPLFRGAIMGSGTMLPAAAADARRTQSRYDIIVKNVVFLNITTNTNILINTYLPRKDGFIFSDTSYNLVKAGTIFTLNLNLQNSSSVLNHLYKTFSDTSVALVRGYADTYVEDVSAGSPYRTGIFNNIYPQFKRISAITGDYMFTLKCRLFLDLASTAKSAVPSWSYIGSYFYGLPVIGTFHSSDILPAFGTLRGNACSSIQGYYISFVNNLDPNTGTSILLPTWPKWKGHWKYVDEYWRVRQYIDCRQFQTDKL